MKKFSAIPYSYVASGNVSVKMMFVMPEKNESEIVVAGKDFCRILAWDSEGNMVEVPISQENMLGIAQEIVDRLTTEAAT